MKSFVPFQSTSAWVSARPSARTRSSFHVLRRRVEPEDVEVVADDVPHVRPPHPVVEPQDALGTLGAGGRAPAGVGRARGLDTGGRGRRTVLASVTGSPLSAQPLSTAATTATHGDGDAGQGASEATHSSPQVVKRTNAWLTSRIALAAATRFETSELRQPWRGRRCSTSCARDAAHAGQRRLVRRSGPPVRACRGRSGHPPVPQRRLRRHRPVGSSGVHPDVGEQPVVARGPARRRGRRRSRCRC